MRLGPFFVRAEGMRVCPQPTRRGRECGFFAPFSPSPGRLWTHVAGCGHRTDSVGSDRGHAPTGALRPRFGTGEGILEIRFLGLRVLGCGQTTTDQLAFQIAV